MTNHLIVLPVYLGNPFNLITSFMTFTNVKAPAILPTEIGTFTAGSYLSVQIRGNPTYACGALISSFIWTAYMMRFHPVNETKGTLGILIRTVINFCTGLWPSLFWPITLPILIYDAHKRLESEYSRPWTICISVY